MKRAGVNVVIFHTSRLQSAEVARTSGSPRLSIVPLLATLAWVALVSLTPAAAAQGNDGFRQVIEALWPEAQGKGVSRATFDAAFAGVEPDLSLPDLILPGKTESDVKGQAEFTRTPADYVNAATLAKLADQGKTLLIKHRDALERIERELGVPRQFVLAIWFLF
jgi:membrane-bound lytic murein transglycosylase B